MKWTVTIASAAIAFTTLAADAASRPKSVIEQSPDVLRPQQLRKSAARTEVAALTSPLAVTAAAPTAAEVGDADSFGRNVTYLGLAQTLPITITSDCTGSDSTLETCIVSSPPPLATSFSVADATTVSLPAKATKSLVCFAFTPFLSVSWANNTGGPQIARFSASADIRIENPVLDDPALINPNTGLPFGGSISLSLSTWHNTHSIANGDFEDESSQQTRSCIAGVISKGQLVAAYGLTDALANQFFKKPMTLHFGTHGSV
jgi:hypothetical protein